MKKVNNRKMLTTQRQPGGQNLQNSFLTWDIKEFNIILLILIGIFLISISGYSSYAIFSDDIVSNGEINGVVKRPATYTKKVCTRFMSDYGWVDANTSGGNCNLEIDCCATSASKACNSESDIDNLKYTGCSSTARYRFTDVQTCTQSGSTYRWVATDSSGGYCNGNINCCTSKTCSKSTKGTYKYTNCSLYTNYEYSVIKKCQKLAEATYSDWSCTESTGQTECVAQTSEFEEITCIEE